MPPLNEFSDERITVVGNLCMLLFAGIAWLITRPSIWWEKI